MGIFSKFKKLFNSAGGSVPEPGKIDFGSFLRTTPLSSKWGFDRGGPVDRVYIEKFLAEHSADIRGAVIEVANDRYIKKFGAEKVERSDVLDVLPDNPQATIICDLAQGDKIPSESYDCFILTQTLHLIFDLQAAVSHVYRALKPGGTLLMTVPGISHFPKENPRYWAFTEFSVRKLLEAEFSRNNIDISVHGNVLTAAAFLYGVGATELKQEHFEHDDNDYQMIITARAVK